jgi:hypothetical protein
LTESVQHFVYEVQRSFHIYPSSPQATGQRRRSAIKESSQEQSAERDGDDAFDESLRFRLAGRTPFLGVCCGTAAWVGSARNSMVFEERGNLLPHQVGPLAVAGYWFSEARFRA